MAPLESSTRAYARWDLSTNSSRVATAGSGPPNAFAAAAAPPLAVDENNDDVSFDVIRAWRANDRSACRRLSACEWRNSYAKPPNRTATAAAATSITHGLGPASRRRRTTLPVSLPIDI